jgi:GNAT superfamily N-acetyltransferase
MHEIDLRPARPDDIEWVKWALYTAVAWDPGRSLPPPEVTVEHPELARYHRGWGRPGDLGVVAERGGQVVGVALCRLFTDDDHGHGYVDAETPELAVAVTDELRGSGLGTRLLDALAERARAAGVAR